MLSVHVVFFQRPALLPRRRGHTPASPNRSVSGGPCHLKLETIFSRYGGLVFGENVSSIPAEFSKFKCVNINCDTVKRLGVRKAVKVFASIIVSSPSIANQ